MELNVEKLVNVIKEGFKTQNEALVQTIESNNQTQQGPKNQSQYIPMNQMQTQQTQNYAQNYAQNFPLLIPPTNSQRLGKVLRNRV